MKVNEKEYLPRQGKYPLLTTVNTNEREAKNQGKSGIQLKLCYHRNAETVNSKTCVTYLLGIKGECTFEVTWLAPSKASYEY